MTEGRRQLHAVVSAESYSGWAGAEIKSNLPIKVLIDAVGRVLENDDALADPWWKSVLLEARRPATRP